MLKTALLVLLTASQPNNHDRLNSRFRFFGTNGTANSTPATPPPLFAFATSSGAGMTAECAGTALTGTNGEVATFTRASSAYCTIGNETSGLSNSSMVLLTSDKPRAMKGGDGSGTIGFLAEESRTNDVIQSQAFDNAAWGVFALVVATPIVTANAAVAPDGTTTAERVQFPAVAAAAQVSLLDQTGLGGGQRSLGLYLKGVSGSGVLHLMNGAPYTCTLCTYNATSWTRCVHENSPGTEVYFGLDPVDCGGGARAAQDVYAWQLDDQNGPSLTSPIATTSAAATRAADVGLYFAGVSFAGMTATGSVSFTVTNRPAALAAGGAFAAHTPAASEQPATMKDDATLLQVYDGTNLVSVASGQPSASGKHYWVSWTGTTLTATNVTDSAQTVGTFDGAFDEGSGIDVGFLRLATNYPLNGVISNVCLDSVSTRCR